MAIKKGTRVRFLADNMGASLLDELHRVTGERYGTSDTGTVAFKHHNPKAKGWWYVEVESKEEPGAKRYVGAHFSQIQVAS